jgi:hypothetical protein
MIPWSPAPCSPASALGVDALRDLAGLLGQEDEDVEVVGAEDLVRVGVADLPNDLADDRLVVDAGGGGDLAGEDDAVLLDEHLAGDAAARVLGEVCVEDGVGDASQTLSG